MTLVHGGGPTHPSHAHKRHHFPRQRMPGLEALPSPPRSLQGGAWAGLAAVACILLVLALGALAVVATHGNGGGLFLPPEPTLAPAPLPAA